MNYVKTAAPLVKLLHNGKYQVHIFRHNRKGLANINILSQEFDTLSLAVSWRDRYAPKRLRSGPKVRFDADSQKEKWRERSRQRISILKEDGKCILCQNKLNDAAKFATCFECRRIKSVKKRMRFPKMT